MASREEEKRKRREERQAAEAAHAAAQARTRRLQFLLGALLTIGVIAVVVLVAAGSGGGGSSSPGSARTPTTSRTRAKIPALKEANLDAAAKAAGCVLRNPPIEGTSHVEGKVQYKTDPPNSGNHNANPARDGIYDPGSEPKNENILHALEHSRISVQYAKDLPAAQVAQVEAVVSEELNGRSGYKTLLSRNDSGMPYAVAATAWGHILGCKTFNARIFDAIRDFRTKYVDKGPEAGVPPNN